jgi:hypothetical protein
MPAFEGLFDSVPGLDNLVQDLLFTLATWHAHAKYRLQTDAAIDRLKVATRALGFLMRKFRNATMHMKTRELNKEREVRLRRAAKKAAKEGRAVDTEEPLTSLSKIFNLSTFKWHALGDYATAIERLGTTDNYNTQVVGHFISFIPYTSLNPIQGELEHRRVKRFYARTNKNKSSTARITILEMRVRRIRRVDERMQAAQQTNDVVRPEVPSSAIPLKRQVARDVLQAEPLPQATGEEHHQISTDVRNPVRLSTVAAAPLKNDPAFKACA